MAPYHGSVEARVVALGFRYVEGNQPRTRPVTLIGLISDTHRLLRAEAVAALAGVDRILHAGDVGDPGVLAALGDLAPVEAVRGNVDSGAWADTLPDRLEVEVEGIRLMVVHDRASLPWNPAVAGVQVVVCGHSHKPLLERRHGVLFLNPGSAGRCRFHLPVAVGLLRVDGARVEGEIVTLLV